MLDTSISGRRVVRELADLIAERGAPRMIVSDNPEFQQMRPSLKEAKFNTTLEGASKSALKKSIGPVRERFSVLSR
ncbi:hypothetical protein QFZ54_003726 [Sphingomonas faeni]|nr:hypothetical protein [Sphingomonas faeni]